MDKGKIELFIDETNFDLDTIGHLIDYGRLNDSLPIMIRVLSRIQSFKSNFEGGENHIEGLFLDAFWKKIVQGRLTTGELRLKILEITKGLDQSKEKDLDEMGYAHFFELVRSWAIDNLSLLKKKIKSPLQKNIERFFVVIVLGLISLWIISAVINSIISRDWGLNGDFYNGENFDRHVWSKRIKTLDFSFCEEMDSHTATGLEHFSARWKGNLLIPEDGNYVFTELVDDGGRIFIDNKLILETWTIQPPTEYSRKIFLKEGKHTFLVEYKNIIGGCTLRLYWEGPGIPKQIIPARYLRP